MEIEIVFLNCLFALMLTIMLVCMNKLVVEASLCSSVVIFELITMIW